jgi:hypothetical protein
MWPRRYRAISTGRALGIAGGVLASSGLVVGEPTAKAASNAEPPLLWAAPEACPGRDAVLEHVAVIAGQESVRWSRFSQIRGAIQPLGVVWRLTLEFAGKNGVAQRTFESGRCAELAEAAAVAIVLAHREEALGGSKPVTTPKAATPRARDEALRAHPQTGRGARGERHAPDASGTTDATGAAASVEREGLDSDATANDGIAPGGSTSEIPSEDGARRAADDVWADGAGTGEATVGDVEEAAASAATPLELALGVEALVDTGTLGAAALGGSLALELRRGRLEGDLYGLLLPAVTTPLGADQAIEIGLWTSGARGCWRWGQAFDTCASFELGQVRATGVGLARAGEGQDVWAAPGVEVAWSGTPFAGLAVTTRVSAFHPLVRGRFRVDESDVIHRIPFIGFRAAVGIALPLL